MSLSLNELRDPMTVLRWVLDAFEEIDPDEDTGWMVCQTVRQSLELCEQIPPDPDPEMARLKGILANVAAIQYTPTIAGALVDSDDMLAMCDLVGEFAPENEPA